jgi:ribosomal protein S18 acetylase RimI-like enzyme
MLEAAHFVDQIDAQFVDEFVEIASIAAESYDRFVYSSPAEALRTQRALYNAGVTEYNPPAGRVLIANGSLLGMIAVLDFALVRRRRIAAALAMARHGELRGDDAIAERRRLAATTFVRIGDQDAYLSRIAVSRTYTRRGIGQLLLAEVFAESRRLSARRCVLDVAEDNSRAITFYERAGFVQIGRMETTDPETGRSFANLHLAKQS